MPPLPVSTLALLWAQAPPTPTSLPNWLLWLFVWGEPAVSVPGVAGALITWLKVVGLFCLIGWTGSWVLAALKSSHDPGAGSRGRWLDLALLAGILGAMIAALLGVMRANNRLPASAGSIPPIVGLASGALVLLWAESRLWSAVLRTGTRADRLVVVAMHLALAAGFGVSFGLASFAGGQGGPGWREAVVTGGRLGATYMGFVVLARVAGLLLPELSALRARRLYAIAWQSWTEAFRRMWAPWVVIAIFVVILAFTTWFLQTPRPAELGRLYVGTLMLLTSILLTVLIVILAPISLPNDIRQQTIYTIVSKPVRRLELVWGRVLGYMALVTLLLLIFGGGSLMYYNRMVNAAIAEAEARAEQATKENKTEFARQYREQAEQLRTRVSARVPVGGSLIFFDSRNRQRRQGIDVGIELPMRSFVEGATPSRAVWRFGPGIVNPRNPEEAVDRTIPVANFLRRDTIEWVEDEVFAARDRIAQAQQLRGAPDVRADELKQITGTIQQAEAELKDLQAQLANLQARDLELRKAGKAAEAAALHSPPVPIEMTFTVYRTTKGDVGEPVYAQLTATSPRPEVGQEIVILPIREYYTNKRALPARLLAGSNGRLTVEIKCLSPNQYLGMAEGDLFLLARQGRFWSNFMRGLFGVWLQALVLTAIGVCVGTFLSWPVALLTTIAFFVAGNVGFTALQQFALSADLVGGGPFESLIRMLSHENLVSDLAPTVAVVIARTLDAVVMPVMSRLVYLVPNFTALDVSNVVAEGFSVSWSSLGGMLLLAVAYALPFSVAGYFILRNREVAA